LYGKNRCNKVLNLTPKIHSNSFLFKGKGRERREGKRGEVRRGSIPQIKFYD
jgi:hypothetical protein